MCNQCRHFTDNTTRIRARARAYAGSHFPRAILKTYRKSIHVSRTYRCIHMSGDLRSIILCVLCYQADSSYEWSSTTTVPYLFANLDATLERFRRALHERDLLQLLRFLGHSTERHAEVVQGTRERGVVLTVVDCTVNLFFFSLLAIPSMPRQNKQRST